MQHDTLLLGTTEPGLNERTGALVALALQHGFDVTMKCLSSGHVFIALVGNADMISAYRRHVTQQPWGVKMLPHADIEAALADVADKLHAIGG